MSRSSWTPPSPSFPTRFRYLVVTRFALTTVGSVLVIVLLALPPANDYFSG